jgi:hypothetical protein
VSELLRIKATTRDGYIYTALAIEIVGLPALLSAPFIPLTVGIALKIVPTLFSAYSYAPLDVNLS